MRQASAGWKTLESFGCFRTWKTEKRKIGEVVLFGQPEMDPQAGAQNDPFASCAATPCHTS